MFVVTEKFMMIPFSPVSHQLASLISWILPYQNLSRLPLHKLNSRFRSLAFRPSSKWPQTNKFLYQLLHSYRISLPGGQPATLHETQPWVLVIIYLLPQRPHPSILPIEILPTVLFYLLLTFFYSRKSFSLSPLMSWWGKDFMECSPRVSVQFSHSSPYIRCVSRNFVYISSCAHL